MLQSLMNSDALDLLIIAVSKSQFLLHYCSVTKSAFTSESGKEPIYSITSGNNV